MRYRYIILLAIAFTFTACGPTADFIADDFQQPHRIAVLPVINNTVDLTASEVIRSVSFVNLYNYQYSELLNLAETDSLLREYGITDGGQLSAIDLKELHDILKCDGLLLIELKEARYATAGARREHRVVHAQYGLYSGLGKLYEHDVKIEKKSGSIVGGLLSFASNPSGALVDRATDTVVREVRGLILEHQLLPEMNENFEQVLLTIPGEKDLRRRRDRI